MKLAPGAKPEQYNDECIRPADHRRASFYGSMRTLLVNGKKLRASEEIISPETPVTYVDVVVLPKQSVTVSR